MLQERRTYSGLAASKRLPLDGNRDKFITWLEDLEQSAMHQSRLTTPMLAIRNWCLPNHLENYLHLLHPDCVLTIPAAKPSLWSNKTPKKSITVEEYIIKSKILSQLALKSIPACAGDEEEVSSGEESDAEVTLVDTSQIKPKLMTNNYKVGEAVEVLRNGSWVAETVSTYMEVITAPGESPTRRVKTTGGFLDASRIRHIQAIDPPPKADRHTHIRRKVPTSVQKGHRRRSKCSKEREETRRPPSNNNEPYQQR
jgi:hypothetical protein